MSCGLKKSEWVDILSTIHDNLESIEAKSFKEMKEDFEAMMLEMQKELDKTKEDS
ncbi:MAG: hypothetical protein RR959_06050 [Erysipelotrichaceae bacterium]